MKTSLFLILAVTSFALCNCQQQTTPATTEAPVAPPPIKVSTEKNEASTIVYGGDVAPANVKGKTFVFRYTNGQTRNFDYFNSPNQRTRVDKKGRTVVSGSEGDYVFYTKTSGKTAEVKVEGSDGSAEIWILSFDTPTTGTAIEKESFDDEITVKAGGLTFTIN